MPLKTATENETLKGAGGAAAAARPAPRATSRSTRPAPAAARQRLQLLRKNRTTDGLRRRQDGRRTTEVAPGAVNSLDVAMLVDKSVRPRGRRSRRRVAAPPASTPARGDTLSVARSPSPSATPAPKAGPIPTGLLGPPKYVALGLGVLLFLFFCHPGSASASPPRSAEPTWLREISAPCAGPELGDGSQARPAAGALAASGRPSRQPGPADRSRSSSAPGWPRTSHGDRALEAGRRRPRGDADGRTRPPCPRRPRAGARRRRSSATAPGRGRGAVGRDGRARGVSHGSTRRACSTSSPTALDSKAGLMSGGIDYAR